MADIAPRGLMSQEQQAGLGQPQPQQPQQPPAQGGRGLTPQQPSGITGELDQFDIPPDLRKDISRFATIGTEILVKEPFLSRAAELIQKADNPAEAMGQIGAAIAIRVYKEAEKAKGEVDLGAVMLGGFFLMRKIAELAKKIGIDVSEQMFAEAFATGMDVFKNWLESEGKVSEAELGDAYAEVQAALRGGDNQGVPVGPGLGG